MKRAAILIAVTVLVFAGCKPKKMDDEGDKVGMNPASMADMAAMEPAGDMGGVRPAPAGDDATAELDKIVVKTKELAKIMEGIKTLDDLKKRRPEYVKIHVEILTLTIASLRKAVKLSPEGLGAYVAKSASMNKANANFSKKMVELKKAVMKIKGAKELLATTQKELAEKIKPLVKEMGELTQTYSKKLADLKVRAPAQPGAVQPGRANGTRPPTRIFDHGKLSHSKRVFKRSSGKVEVAIHTFQISARPKLKARIDGWILTMSSPTTPNSSAFTAEGKDQSGTISAQCHPSLVTTVLLSFYCRGIDARMAVEDLKNNTGGGSNAYRWTVTVFTSRRLYKAPIALSALLRPGVPAKRVIQAAFANVAKHLEITPAAAWKRLLASRTSDFAWKDWPWVFTDDGVQFLSLDLGCVDDPCTIGQLTYKQFLQFAVTKGTLYDLLVSLQRRAAGRKAGADR